MILIIKAKTYKNIIRRVLSFSVLIVMFSLYYNHMNNEFKELNSKFEQKLKDKTVKVNTKFNLSKKIERIIYKEAEKCVDLLGQDKIKSIKIVKNKLLIVCDWDTKTEPIYVRYGVLALVKSTPESVKIAIDLKFMVETRYES